MQGLRKASHTRARQCVKRARPGGHSLSGGPDVAWAENSVRGRLDGLAKREVRMPRDTRPFPVLRWVALTWMIVWLPAYVRVGGWSNLLHLCDLALILAGAGFWWGSPLLISSQAVSILVAGVLWCLDAGWKLATGRYLVGGTEYMWDARYPLAVRLLSLFHIGLPIALLWGLRMVRYDQRGLATQSGIAAGPLILSRFFAAAPHLN